MIKTGGENVASREVEEILFCHAAIAEVAVFGVPDDKWVEAVSAVAVLRMGAQATTDELRQHCAQHLAGFKVPKHIFLADSLPKNPSGKVLKRDLRSAYADAVVEASQVPRHEIH